MPFTRAYEESDISPELKRIYADIRCSFDLPFVPTIFKLMASAPEYLKIMWDDLGPVARSSEFRSASTALDEYIRSLAIRGGWRFADQQKILASHKFSQSDVETLGAVISTFTRGLPKMILFTRLMQRGYSGGQTGRVSQSKLPAALSRLITLQVPNEKEAGMRVWLIYADFKRTTGAKTVPSVLRVLSPFPGYLGSVWVDMKKLIGDSAFQRARDDISKRSLGLLVGLPVRDHRSLVRRIEPAAWREIEETVDGFTRTLPQLSLLVAAWLRAYPQFFGNFLVA
jgi:hypothetical protein